MNISRRTLLRYAGAAGLSGATAASLTTALTGFQQASAADISGYRALVCIFLLGGMDCHDTVLPFDEANYESYAQVRSSLLSSYNQLGGGSTRVRDRLLPLNPVNASQFEGRQFALPEELSELHDLFESGRASIVGNVGPLIEPLTLDQFRQRTGRIPRQLFSHNDQQSTWMANAPEGARRGWGGRFADAAISSSANSGESFTTISTAGSSVFLVGDRAQPYELGRNGAGSFDQLARAEQGRNSEEGEESFQRLRAFLQANDYDGNNLIGRDIASIQETAFLANEAYNNATQNAPDLPISFANDALGPQLEAVARAIQARDALGQRRQVFFVAFGNFDTHSSQAADLPGLQRTLSDGISRFVQTMDAFGLMNDVTVFTASDFGRSLASNGDGTDHGWGGHHFVIGDAVEGQTIFGDIPPYDLGHANDAGAGRLLPSLSVDQYAEPLGRWFGLTEEEIALALPGLSNFSSQESLKLFPGPV